MYYIHEIDYSIHILLMFGTVIKKNQLMQTCTKQNTLLNISTVAFEQVAVIEMQCLASQVIHHSFLCIESFITHIQVSYTRFREIKQRHEQVFIFILQPK